MSKPLRLPVYFGLLWVRFLLSSTPRAPCAFTLTQKTFAGSLFIYIRLFVQSGKLIPSWLVSVYLGKRIPSLYVLCCPLRFVLCCFTFIFVLLSLSLFHFFFTSMFFFFLGFANQRKSADQLKLSARLPRPLANHQTRRLFMYFIYF